MDDDEFYNGVLCDFAFSMHSSNFNFVLEATLLFWLGF